MTGANNGHSWAKPHRHGTCGYFWHFKQAVTPLKPHGRVGGFTGATAFADGEGSDGEGTLGRQMGDFTGFTWRYGWDLPLSLKVQVG